jgi:hypothetical protein
VLSKGSRPLEWGEVECISDKFAPGRYAGMSTRVCSAIRWRLFSTPMPIAQKIR